MGTRRLWMQWCRSSDELRRIARRCLYDALTALAALDDRKSRVVELRFFGGLTADEAAVALQVSSKTVLRDWEFARARLQRELTREDRRDA
jgi:RNA polymerase sigma factor (sigma-70 family)